jgi:hypothetical protein
MADEEKALEWELYFRDREKALAAVNDQTPVAPLLNDECELYRIARAKGITVRRPIKLLVYTNEMMVHVVVWAIGCFALMTEHKGPWERVVHGRLAAATAISALFTAWFLHAAPRWTPAWKGYTLPISLVAWAALFGQDMGLEPVSHALASRTGSFFATHLLIQTVHAASLLSLVVLGFFIVPALVFGVLWSCVHESRIEWGSEHTAELIEETKSLRRQLSRMTVHAMRLAKKLDRIEPTVDTKHHLREVQRQRWGMDPSTLVNRDDANEASV